MGIWGWSTTAMASRHTHLVTPIHNDVASRLDGLLWATSDGDVEGRLRLELRLSRRSADRRFGRIGVSPSQLAVAAGFEPAEAFTSRAFEFCVRWISYVQIGAGHA